MKAFYGKNGKRCKDELSNVYVIKYKYDTHGQRTSQSYWKTPNKPMNRWDGYHEHVNRYDSRGFLSERRYLDKNGKAKKLKTGESSTVFKYDEQGHFLSRAYFHDDAPVLSAGSSWVRKYHRLECTLDSRGRVTDIRYFGLSNEAVGAYLHKIHKAAHRVKFIYAGAKVAEQLVYGVGSSLPARTLNCSTQICLKRSGIAPSYP